MTSPDPRVTKRRVTMVDRTMPDLPVTHTDYVRPDILDAYLADAYVRFGLDNVTVADEPDAGPGGYHGATYVPAHLNHPLAGKLFAATEET